MTASQQSEISESIVAAGIRTNYLAARVMGSVGVPFPITEGLDAAWAYQPSVENMRRLPDISAYSTFSRIPGSWSPTSLHRCATKPASSREDQVTPLDTSLRLLQLIDLSQLHVFGRCGHWTQVERSAQFNRLLDELISG